ncbi:MAG: TonB-dependent receptor [Sinobacteraceae bacterium]|nr:TonB-dependent receptor [Nevskiaceae bacterium]
MSKFARATHVLWVAPLTLCVALPVSAQAPDDGATLEEIVVTARKREENLQDVPIAVTAISADTLQREGIKDIEGVIDRDPSLSFDRGIAPYDTRIVIRGLSPTRGRPNVATLVDGIDVSSEAIGVAGGSLLINPRLVDIERIEIVKGPQSALYGRSAFAGAISYITADPDDEVSGNASAEYSEHEAFDIKGSLSLPISDTLGIRVNAYKFDDRGIYRNTTGGEYVGGGDGLGGSLTLKWAPTDSYSLKLRSEFSDDHFDQPAQASVAFNGVAVVPAAASSCRTYSIANPAGGTLVATGPVLDASCQFVDANAALPANTLNLARTFQTAVLGAAPTAITADMAFDDMNVPSYRGQMVRGNQLAVTYNPDFTRSRDNGLTAPAFTGTNREVTRFSAVQELNVSFGTFSSLTGYTRAEVGTDLDFDKTARTIIQQNIKTESLTKQVSQELRFTSDFEGPLQFITGYQYWTERADQTDRNNTVFGAGTACPLLSIPFPPPGRLLCATQASPVGRAYTETSASPYMDDAAAARQPSLVNRKVDHQSLYLEFEWDVSETFRLIGEARYIDEDNEVEGPVTAGNQGPGTVILCGATGDCRTAASIPYAAQPGLPATFAGAAQIRRQSFARNDSYITPKATVQWQPSDDLNLYGSYSIGKKPGGFGTLTIGAFGLPNREDVEFDPERIKVYELGAKWTSPARNVQLSAAAFLQDFTDKQVSTQVIIGNTLGNRITNAGGAELQGLELSGLWRASEYLTVGFGLTHFLKYEFTDYTTLSGGAAEIARTGTCTPVTTVIATAGVNQAKTTCAVSRNGNKIEDTPETAAALNLGYRRPYGSEGNYWFADADMSYVGERFIEDDNTIWLEAYTNLNLRFGVGSETWSATLFIDNATDDDKVKSAGTGPGNAFADARAAPRVGTAGALPANLTNPVAAFGLAIPTAVFAEMPRPRTIGFRVNYKF